MVAAHSGFVSRLRMLNFSVAFYECLLGCADLPELLDKSANMIQSCVVNTNVAIYLRRSGCFEYHQVNENFEQDIEARNIESYFTGKRSEEICSGGNVVYLDEMDDMCEDAELLSKVSAATVPLGRVGDCLGFILLYRYIEHRLEDEELARVAAITPGMAKAVKAMHRQLNTAGPEFNGT